MTGTERPLPDDFVVASGETVRAQLLARDIRIPGHATASLERTRNAIRQLSAAHMLTSAERKRLDKRFSSLVR